MIKLSVSTFGQTAVYRIYTVNREPIRLPYQNFNIQCLVFNKTIILLFANMVLINRGLYGMCFASDGKTFFSKLVFKLVSYESLITNLPSHEK